MHHTSLGHFYFFAHAQYFLVLVFNPIKFLHVLLIGLEKVYTTPSDQINFIRIELNWID